MAEEEKKGTAATRAKNKWQSANCDRINLVVPKGKKATIKEFAESKEKSLNGFINEAIDEKIERDSNAMKYVEEESL